jgi:hypothetical protein
MEFRTLNPGTVPVASSTAFRHPLLHSEWRRVTGEDVLRFMESLHDSRIAHRGHEPDGSRKEGARKAVEGWFGDGRFVER